VLHSGPDGIKAGQQVTISYGPWPTEPLLLLFGFVPQHNPHDSLVVFSDLQHMAECCLQLFQSRCRGSSSSSSSSSDGGMSSSSDTAAAAAACGFVHDPGFAELLCQTLQGMEDVQLAEGGPQGEGAGGQALPPGYTDLTVYASSAADVRLSTGLQRLQGAVAAATVQWCASSQATQQQQQHQEACKQYLEALVPAVLPYRLQQLAQQLQASAETAADGAYSNEELVEVVDEHISYSASAEHCSLIAAYCSSKAQLAKELLGKR